MKKIINTFVILCCILLASCSDDRESDISELKIISSDVSFDAAGGSGAIKVDTKEAITATSSKDWCTVSIDGTMVNVTVPENNEMSARTAAVMITSGGLKTLIPVTQGGAITLYKKSELGHAFTYAGGSAIVSFKSSTNYKIEIPAEAKDWLSYTEDLEKGTLTFTVAPSIAKIPRGAAVKVICGLKTIVYNVGEYEIQDIAGDWRVSFNDGEDDLAGNIKVVQNATQPTLFSLTGVSNYFNLPLIFSQGVLSARVGVYLGRYASLYNIYTVALSEGGYLTWSPDVQYVAYPSSIDGEFALVFGDNGTMPGDVINGVLYWAFSGAVGVGSAGSLERFLGITLSKNLEE